MLLQMALFHSVLWLSSIPLCVCWGGGHICFIHSPVSGHLVSFHVLAIVNSAAVYDCQPVSFDSGLLR